MEAVECAELRSLDMYEVGKSSTLIVYYGPESLAQGLQSTGHREA